MEAPAFKLFFKIIDQLLPATMTEIFISVRFFDFGGCSASCHHTQNNSVKKQGAKPFYHFVLPLFFRSVIDNKATILFFDLYPALLINRRNVFFSQDRFFPIPLFDFNPDFSSLNTLFFCLYRSQGRLR